MQTNNSNSNAGGYVPNFNPALARKLENNQIARSQNLPSPIFPFKNASAMTTGTYYVFDLTNDTQQYSFYAPFTNVKIVNTSSQPIYIYFGEIGANYDFIPQNYSNTYTKQDLGGGVSAIKIYNAGSGTINANEIIVSVWNSGTTTEDIALDAQKGVNKIFPLKFNRYKSII